MHAAFYNLKMKYDESDNLVIRASRVVTDRVGDAFSGVMTQSDMAEALTEILKIDPSFSKEKFVQQCQFEIIPVILEVGDSLDSYEYLKSGVEMFTLFLQAFLRGDTEVLKDWCHEAVSSLLMYHVLLLAVKKARRGYTHLPRIPPKFPCLSSQMHVSLLPLPRLYVIFLPHPLTSHPASS